MREVLCPTCEFPVDLGRMSVCPKCGEGLKGKALQGVLEVDVAHGGERVGEAAENSHAQPHCRALTRFSSSSSGHSMRAWPTRMASAPQALARAASPGVKMPLSLMAVMWSGI